MDIVGDNTSYIYIYYIYIKLYDYNWLYHLSLLYFQDFPSNHIYNLIVFPYICCITGTVPACCTGGRGLGPQLVFGPRVKPTGKNIGK